MLESVLEMNLPAEATDELCLLTHGPRSVGSDYPQWFGELRAKGWDRFRELPAPSRADQSWRFADLSRLDLSSIRVPRSVESSDSARLVAASTGTAAVAGKLVFAGDAVAEFLPISPELAAQGVVFTPIQQAMVEHEAMFRARFMEHSSPLGGAKYQALHQAYAMNGTFLYVPDNVVVKLPLEAFHWLSGESGSAFPHTLLIAGRNSKVTLVDRFRSADPRASGFACAVNDIYAGEGAQVTYSCVQDWGREVISVQINSTTVGANASVTGLNVNLGGSYSRFESVSHLEGRGGRSDMLALTVADGDQEFDMRTLQDHMAPGASSDLLFKNALKDSSHTIFAGLIRVERGAHQTDAYQTNRNLVLSDEAEADSMPGLEILADEVKCSHGATTGYLGDEELFYLQARGIPPEKAKTLLMGGFLDEVLQRLRDEQLADSLRGEIQTRLGES